MTVQSLHTIKAEICSPKPAARRVVRSAAKARWCVCFAGISPEKYVVTTIDYSGKEPSNRCVYTMSDNRQSRALPLHVQIQLWTANLIYHRQGPVFVQNMRSTTDLVQAEGVFPANAGTETRRMVIAKTGLRLGGRPGHRLGPPGNYLKNNLNLGRKESQICLRSILQKSDEEFRDDPERVLG